jgi:hypothetical protein
MDFRPPTHRAWRSLGHVAMSDVIRNGRQEPMLPGRNEARLVTKEQLAAALDDVFDFDDMPAGRNPEDAADSIFAALPAAAPAARQAGVHSDDRKAPAPAEGLREALAQYAGALEAIIRSLPGGPIVNGVPLSTEEAIADLRERFDVDDAVIDQATLRAGITHDLAAQGNRPEVSADDPISDARQPEDGPPPGRWPR